MADITMCGDLNCPLRKNCYRATANASQYQSWFASSPRDGEKCEMHWPNSVSIKPKGKKVQKAKRVKSPKKARKIKAKKARK